MINIINKIKNRLNRHHIYSTAKYWDGKAGNHLNSEIYMWENKYLNELYENEQYKIIYSNIKIFNGKSILDLGCGTGRFSRWFANMGFNVTGIDFSGRCIEIAKKLDLSNSINYIQDSIFDYSTDEKFDLIFTWGVLAIACKNINDFNFVLNKMKNSLNPGGRIIIVEPFHSNFLHRVLSLDINEAIKLLKQNSFLVKNVSYLHFWPTRMLLSYFQFPKSITEFFYHTGQYLMSLSFFKKFGDYQAIVLELDGHK